MSPARERRRPNTRAVGQMSVSDRIKRDVTVDQAKGCWLWQGQVGPGGYGRITIARRPQKAHRASYEAFVGPIPDGLQLDHLCRVRHCVNPEHLEPVTAKENNHRSPLTPANVTHCPKGHPYDAENTYETVRPDGRHRQCKTCRRDWMRESHRRKAQEAADFPLEFSNAIW